MKGQLVHLLSLELFSAISDSKPKFFFLPNEITATALIYLTVQEWSATSASERSFYIYLEQIIFKKGHVTEDYYLQFLP